MSVFISVVLEHGEIPETICSGPGIAKSFANFFDDLDEMARRLHLTPLKDFYVETDYQAIP